MTYSSSPFYPQSNPPPPPQQAVPDLTNEAVAMLKQGRPPEIVHAHLVARGVDGWHARALIDQLLALKQQAEALDPNRLREEAKWMLFQGASIDHVVQHFVSTTGVTAEAARPEIERIASAVREMRPCDRCRSPAPPADLYFDAMGNRICRRCRSMDDIGNAERRVVDNALESLGVPGMVVQATYSSRPPNAITERPFCPRCRVASGTHVNALHPAARAQVHPGWQYVCAQCMHGLL